VSVCYSHRSQKPVDSGLCSLVGVVVALLSTGFACAGFFGRGA
jgi:hypothetical protein